MMDNEMNGKYDEMEQLGQRTNKFVKALFSA